MAGIKLNDRVQLEYLRDCGRLNSDFPYSPSYDETLRFTFDNNQFGESDAVFLFCMLLLIKPKQVIEVGSGFSSPLMLDVNERYFGNKLKLTFVDPYPQRLKGTLKKTDKPTVIVKQVQNLPLDLFKELTADDVLFINSSHISKSGSDVNFLYFEFLPNLKKVVYVHIHDAFYPFDYPKEWIKEGRSWNELYLLRAFLINNSGYEIVL